MDLIEILRDRMNALDAGDHTPGLRAVLRHIEVAAKHLTRGSTNNDDSAFTDTIYRTNQAFEGGLKEAYRVLASADPASKTPFEIENYLQGQSLLRQRVVDQFSTYRKDWRNPSTHDYKLDFDEDEALLAIVSVCAFAIVLIDQIASKISYDKAAAAAPPAEPSDRSKTLFEAVAAILLAFHTEPTAGVLSPRLFESEVVGGIAGLISKVLPDVEVAVDQRLSPSAPDRADLLFKRYDEKLIVELKRATRSSSRRADGIAQVTRYMTISGISDAILYFFDERGHVATEREDHAISGSNGKLAIIRPPSKGETA